SERAALHPGREVEGRRRGARRLDQERREAELRCVLPAGRGVLPDGGLQPCVAAGQEGGRARGEAERELAPNVVGALSPEGSIQGRDPDSRDARGPRARQEDLLDAALVDLRSARGL